MALVVGLIVGFVILLALKLLGASLRYPQWAGIVFLALYSLNYLAQNHLDSKLENVQIAAIRSSSCGQNQVQVRVTNGRTDEIISYAFNLYGYRPNHSKYVTFDALKTDRIIPAGESWANCWGVSQLDQLPADQRWKLRWEIKLTGIEFAE